MKAYKSESEVIGIIEGLLEGATVSHHRDTQPSNTIERKATFKAAVSADTAEAQVNKVFDVGHDTDRSIVYIGSETTPTEQGEIRYLLFETKINPYEE